MRSGGVVESSTETESREKVWFGESTDWQNNADRSAGGRESLLKKIKVQDK